MYHGNDLIEKFTMIIDQAELIALIVIAFASGVIIGSILSFIYWRKRVLSIKSKTRTSFLKIYFTILISVVWLVLTMSEAVFRGPPVNIFVHIIMGSVTGVVLGPDFARFITSVRMGNIPNSEPTNQSAKIPQQK